MCIRDSRPTFRVERKYHVWVRFAQEREAGETMNRNEMKMAPILRAEASKSQSTRHHKWIGQNLY